MNSKQKFDIAFAILFGILEIGAAIAVILGATHQWLMLIVSAIMIVLFVDDYKQESNKQK